MGKEAESPKTAARRHFPTWVAAAASFFVLAALTIRLASDGRAIATVWPANAALLAFLLRRGKAQWLTVHSAGFVANIAANLITREGIVGPLLYGVCNMVEVSIAALLIRPALSGPGLLGSRQAVARFITAAGVVAPLVSSIGGAAVASHAFGQGFVTSFRVWYLSDALGLLLFTPFLFALVNGDYASWLRSRRPWAIAEAVVLLGLVGAVASGVFFFASMPLLFVLYTPVMLVTFRLGGLGTKVSILLVGTIGAVATMRGVGPFTLITSDVIQQAQLFQGFLALLLLTCLPASAELSDRSARLLHLAAREALLLRREAELLRKADTDSLTGVLNHGAFCERASAALARRENAPFCLIAIDLDHFKEVNDRFGHPAGDAALIHLAATLRSGLQEDDMVGRLGGDEFMILLARPDLTQAERTAARLQASLRNAPVALADGTALPIAMSLGLAQRRPGMRFADLAREADKALYRAKSQRTRRNVAA